MNSFIAESDACIILQTMKMSLMFYSFSSFSFVWVHRLPSNGQGKSKELLAPSTMEPAHPLCRGSMVATRKRDAQRPVVGQCPFSAGVGVSTRCGRRISIGPWQGSGGVHDMGRTRPRTTLRDGRVLGRGSPLPKSTSSPGRPQARSCFFYIFNLEKSQKSPPLYLPPS